MQLLKIITLSLLTICIFSQFAYAKNNNVYFGLGYGNTNYQGNTLNDDSLESGAKLTKSSTMYQVYGGYQIIKDSLAVEVSYLDLGSVNETFDLNPDLVFFDSPNNTLSLKGRGLTIAPVLQCKWFDKLSLFGLLGFSVLDVEKVFSGGFSESSSDIKDNYSTVEVNMFGGIGSEVYLLENTSFRMQWQRFQMAETTVDTLFGQIAVYF